MKAPVRNILLGIGVIVAAALLFVALRPGASEEPVAGNDPAAVARDVTGPTGSSEAEPELPKPPSVPKLVIRNGQPVGGILEIEATVGDRVRFKVDSDVPEEIHVHGFDVSKHVNAGQTVTIALDADFTGIFEAELENSAVPIAEIQVNP